MVAINTAMDDVDLAPKAVLALAVQLAATKVTDADHEGRLFDLFAQGPLLGLVEFFGAMGGETEGNVPQFVRQHRHRRRVRPEVRVHVPNSLAGQEARQQARFGEVRQVSKHATVGSSGESDGCPKGAVEAKRPSERGGD